MSKLALVTGGSRGIGKAICLEFAKAGYDVVINYRSAQPEAEAVAQEVIALGQKAYPIQADIANATHVEEMFSKIETIGTTLSVLINNAGWESIEHAIDMPIDEFQKGLNVNLTGVFHCSQLAARIMKKQGQGGSIINNLSIHDETPRLGLVHYCSAKAGALMMTKCLALEWAEFGIRVNAVSPGAIETDINREEIEAFGRDKFDKMIPLGRVGHVSDVSSVVLFLASDASSYMTGTTQYIDGGYRHTTVPYDPRPQK